MVVRALLVCSHEGCAALYETYGRLEEIERLACGCGCGLQVLGWPDPVEHQDGATADLELLETRLGTRH